MATGDIVSVVIDAEGWFATIGIEGFATGAVYNFALTGDNVPSANTPYFTVVSEGYNSSGVLGTMTRTVRVGIQLRKVHPNEAQNDETVTGGVMYFKVPLEEFVYSGDKTGAGNSGTAPTFTAPAGWVTSGGTPSNAATAIAVTNNSTNPYPIPIANWTMPGGERLSTKSVTCSAIGFHASGRDQKPLACIKFVATAPGGYSASTTVANSEIVAGLGDAHPIIEYKGTIDLTAFPDDVVVTTNFIAYPIFGDTPYESTAGSATASVNHFTAPLEWYLDVDGSYGFPMCVVTPGAGAGSGVVLASDDSTNRTTAFGNPYPTIAKAIAALSTYLNTNKGRQTVDGATIYLTGGNHTLINGTEADSVPATTGNCYVTIKPYPSNIVSLNTGSNKIIPAKKIKFEGLTFARSADGSFVDANDNSNIYLLNCTISDSRGSISTSGCFDNTMDFWLVRCTLNKVPGPTAFYRGCSIPQGGVLGRRRLILGTAWKRFGTLSNLFTASTNSTNTSDGFICAFNSFLDCTKGVIDYPGVGAGTFTQGCASVQNLMEYVSGGGSRLMRFAADGNDNVTYNCVVAHNTAVGELCNAFYNDVAGDRHVHLGHVMVLNMTESLASKGDTFADDADCTGNWPVHMGCGIKGNRVAGGNFPNYFRGFWSKAGSGDVGDPTYLDMGFINNVSSSGTGLGGTGNYRPNNTSILNAVGAPQMLKWDLDGNERNSTADAAGAYKYTLIPSPPSAPTNLRLTLSTNIFDANFEETSLPSGYTVDSTGTGTTWGYTPALVGSRSVRVSGSTTGTLRGFTTPSISFPADGSTWMAYFMFKFDVAPTGGNGRFFEVLRASDGLITQIGQVIQTTNVLRLANGSGVSGTGEYALTVGNTYHVWLKRMADGTLQGWVNTTDTYPGGAAMLNGSASVNPGQAGKLHFGGARSMAMIIDKLRVSPTDIGSSPA